MRRSLPLLLCGALAAAALTALGAAPASAATGVPGDPLTGSGAVTRSVLTAAQLASSVAAERHRAPTTRSRCRPQRRRPPHTLRRAPSP